MASALEAGSGVVGGHRGRFIARGMSRPFVLGLLSCTCCSRGAEVRRDTLEIQVPTEVVELDPRYATRGLDVKVTRLIHAGLVALDPDTLLPRPRFARRMVISAERTIDVELDPTRHFHSGRPLEAEDLQWTFSMSR